MPTTQFITTVQGTAPKKCTYIKDLLVTPLTGGRSIPLKNAITHEIPSIIDAIPTPEEVASIPGLAHLATKFPTKQDWPTILLIGRDCLEAQTHEEPTWSQDRCQFATKTPLGWVILGKPANTTRPLRRNPQTPSHNPKNVVLLQQITAAEDHRDPIPKQKKKETRPT